MRGVHLRVVNRCLGFPISKTPFISWIFLRFTKTLSATKMFRLVQRLLLTRRCSLHVDTQKHKTTDASVRECQCKHFPVNLLLPVLLSLDPSLTHFKLSWMLLSISICLSSGRALGGGCKHTHTRTAMTRLKAARAKAIGVAVWQMEGGRERGGERHSRATAGTFLFFFSTDDLSLCLFKFKCSSVFKRKKKKRFRCEFLCNARV